MCTPPEIILIRPCKILIRHEKKNQPSGRASGRPTRVFFFWEMTTDVEDLYTQDTFFFYILGCFPKIKNKATPDIFENRVGKMTISKLPKMRFLNVEKGKGKSELDLVSIYHLST